MTFALLGNSNNNGEVTSRLLNDLDGLERLLLSQRGNFRRQSGDDDAVEDVDADRLRRLIQTLSAAERESLLTLLRRTQSGSRRFRKRNYNLDHLARMNFRRSERAASPFNNRHILGGL